MEFVLLVCSTTLQEEIEELFIDHKIASYTCIPTVYGSGKGGGTKLNTDVWPGLNAMYMVCVESEKYEKLKNWVTDYRKNDPREGIKLLTLALKDVC